MAVDTLIIYTLLGCMLINVGTLIVIFKLAQAEIHKMDEANNWIDPNE